MRYLRKFNETLIDLIDGDQFKLIDYDDIYYDISDEFIKQSMSRYDINRISNIFKNEGYEIQSGTDKYIEVSGPVNVDSKCQAFDINKLLDDVYLVVYFIIESYEIDDEPKIDHDIRGHYLCDSIEGISKLVEYITNNCEI